MEGGLQPRQLKLINQGAYGCIFRPGITCGNKLDTTKYVTKIQKSARALDNEWRISRKVKKIKGYSKYFAPVLKQCNVKIAKSRAKTFQKCETFSDKSTEEITSSTYVSSKIRYVGKTNLREYLLNDTPERKFAVELYLTHTYLLKGLEKLFSAGVVHFDLKYNNIMYDHELEAPVIIDFGLSFGTDRMTTKDQLKSIFFAFEAYSYWCIDVAVCNYIFQMVGYDNAKTEVVTKSELETIFKVFTEGTKGTEVINDAFTLGITKDGSLLSNFKRNYMSYFSEFLGKTWWTVYQDLVKYMNTWDNYSLSVIYLIMLDDAYVANPEKFERVESALADYQKVLENVVYSMPNERPSIKDTIKSLKVLSVD